MKIKGCMTVLVVAIGAVAFSVFGFTYLVTSPPEQKTETSYNNTNNSANNISPQNTQPSFLSPTSADNTATNNINNVNQPNANVTPSQNPNTGIPQSAYGNNKVAYNKIITQDQINSILQSEMQRVHPKFKGAVKDISVRLLEGLAQVNMTVDTRFLPPEIKDKIPFLIFTPNIYIGTGLGVSVINNKPAVYVSSFQMGRLGFPASIISSMINTQSIESVVYNYLVENNVKIESINIRNQQIVINGYY